MNRWGSLPPEIASLYTHWLGRDDGSQFVGLCPPTRHVTAVAQRSQSLDLVTNSLSSPVTNGRRGRVQSQADLDWSLRTHSSHRPWKSAIRADRSWKRDAEVLEGVLVSSSLDSHIDDVGACIPQIVLRIPPRRHSVIGIARASVRNARVLQAKRHKLPSQSTLIYSFTFLCLPSPRRFHS